MNQIWPSAMGDLRVVAFTAYAAGPMVARLLGQFGADVIKIESGSHIDPFRVLEPLPADDQGSGMGGFFTVLNPCNRSITLDLRHEQGVALIKELVSLSDVVVENFRPGVLERFGLGPSELFQVKPDLVVLRMPAMAMSPGWEDVELLGNNLSAMSGLSAISGDPDRMPVDPGVALSDYTYSPLQAMTALLAALHHRHLTGQGQIIEVAQLETACAALGTALLEAAVFGHGPERRGNRSRFTAPQGVYRCQDDNGEEQWCAITVATGEHWRSLCGVMGQPRWADDPRFASSSARLQREDEIDTCIERWTQGQNRQSVVESLQHAGIPAGPVQSPADLLERDPQLQARGYFTELPDNRGSRSLYENPAMHLSATPGASRKPAPVLGQDNDYVFSDLLGKSEDMVNSYIVSEVIG